MSAENGRKTAKKRREGAPSKLDGFTDEQFRQFEALASFGLTNEQLADYFGIEPGTLYDWIKRSPQFEQALKKGKLVANVNVVKSLYKRCLGYYYDEITQEPKMAVRTVKGRKEHVVLDAQMRVTRIVRKHVAADPTSIFFWLQNRWPAKWRNVKSVGFFHDKESEALADPYGEITQLCEELGIEIKTNGELRRGPKAGDGPQEKEASRKTP